MTGRSWPANGAGGTLNAAGTGPGRYYCLAAEGVPQVGSAVGSDGAGLMERAVGYGMLEIQRAVNRLYPRRPIPVDGVFGLVTRDAVLRFQTSRGLVVDGVVGRQTTTALFSPVMGRLSTVTVLKCMLLGLAINESGLDPGAVGYADSDDQGLWQLNAPSHKDTTEEERFSVLFACDRVVTVLEGNYAVLGNERDMVASWNLGLTGAQKWVSRGRPSPDPYYDPPRDVKGYIDRILIDC